VSDITGLLAPSQRTVQGLDTVVQTITNLASQVITGPATSLPNYGLPSKPIVTVVQGDLNISTNTTGYGVLLVTGELRLSQYFGWRGIILVIGQGDLDGAGHNEVDGAIVVAKTRDASNALLGTLGQPVVDWSNGHGPGFFYDSCWINNAMAAFPYKVLSFREIPQLQ
jgi:hypothetical protein